MRRADFATLTEALDYAAQGPTGLNLYGLRGELLLVLPYADLRERARALALRLLAAGLQTGDRVGLIADTGVDFIAAFFACQYAGLIPAPLPLPAPLGGKDAYVTQITGMLSAARAAAVFGPAALADWVQQSGRDAGADHHARAGIEAGDRARSARGKIGQAGFERSERVMKKGGHDNSSAAGETAKMRTKRIRVNGRHMTSW